MKLSEATAFDGLDIAAIRLLGKEERVAYVKLEHWVPYPRATALLGMMDELMNHPKRGRMPCLAIVGEPNSGKSEMLKEFARRHAPKDRPLRETALIPVLFAESPPVADRGELYDALLEAMQTPCKISQKPGAKEKLLIHVMRKTEVKIMLLDELSQAVAIQRKQMETFLNSIKRLSNVLKISVVVGGVASVATTLKNEGQFGSRFDIKSLRVWQLDTSFLRLVKGIGDRSPLREPVILATPEIAPLIHGLSEGHLGDVVELVRRATLLALKAGVETVTPELIRQVDWTPASKRKLDVH